MSQQSSATFNLAKRRSWYHSRSRSLTTCCFFVALWIWFNLGVQEVVMPKDSYEFIQDERLKDIFNTTLGFEKVLVLNLPFRTDRRDAISLSAALTNIKLEFVEGVTGESISQAAYPPPDENTKLLPGIRGSWRTHMSALRRVLEQNLTTAFILEDDVDWDVRVRQNLQRFALASRFLSQARDKLFSSPRVKNQIGRRPNTETENTAIQIIDTKNLPEALFSLPLTSALSSLPTQDNIGLTSPYGDPSQWDVLWLGHCGVGMPRSSSNRSSSIRSPPVDASNIILTSSNDATVPVGNHLKAHPFQGDLDALATAFPPHTRIYHRSTGGELCTVGYAVSQRGARRLLHQFGIKGWNGIFDSELGRWCAGENPDMGSMYAKQKRDDSGKERVCLTSQPPIFAHHHPQQGQSNIGGLGGGYARKYETKYLRYSVRMNLERLVEGAGERDLVDQWPDEQVDSHAL